jgi:hypothetical protein
VKLVPVMSTGSPIFPDDGENPLIAGAGAVTLKLVELVELDPFRDTVIGPDVAPVGTVAVINVWEFAVKDAAVPLNVTELIPMKSVPKIWTDVPTGPDVGEKDVTFGTGAAADADGPPISAAMTASAGTRAAGFRVLLGRMLLLPRALSMPQKATDAIKSILARPAGESGQVAETKIGTGGPNREWILVPAFRTRSRN